MKDDNTARLEVEDLGLSLEDEDVEFEDEEDCLLACTASSSPVTSLEASCLPSNVPSPSQYRLPSKRQPGSSKKAKKAAAARTKRAAAAQERKASGELKGHAIRIAQDATPVELKSFDTSSLPAASNGWTAYSRTKLSPGLQRLWRNLDALAESNLRLLDWDGECVAV